MKHLALLLIILLAFITGCASMLIPKETVLLTEARYSEMEQLMENRIRDIETAPTAELFYLCYAYSKVKRYHKLFPCLDYLQQNIDEGDTRIFGYDYSSVPAALRAEAWTELGDFPKAIDEIDRAYKIAKSGKAPLQFEVYILSGAGLIRAIMGDRMGSERFAAELEATVVPENYKMVSSDKNIGLAKIYMALGDYKRALAAIKRDRKNQPSRFDRLLVGQEFYTFWELPKLYIWNKCLFETGDQASAKAGYDRLLQIPQTKQNGDIYWLILFDRGRIAMTEGNREQAIEFFKLAIEVIEEQRSTINTEASKIGFVGNKQDVYGFLVEQLLETDRFAEAFEYAERAKARALVDMLYAKKSFIGGTGGGATQLTKLLDNLEKIEMESKVQSFEISPQQDGTTRSITVEIKNKVSQANPELASLVSVSPPDVVEIRQLLPSDETLVEYYGTGETLIAFVVTREGVRGLKLQARGLNAEIDSFRNLILDCQSNQFKVGGHSLYKKLIQPLEGMFASRNLTIVPHGSLHYLPFNALYSGKQYLIERYNIRVLPSASVTKFLKVRHEGQLSTLLALGNPDLGDPIYDLPDAEKEAIAISRGQSKARVLVRSQATETALKQLGEQFRYIHFATHGTFDAAKPLTSGLLMTADAENDGTLTVGELYDLSLNADLVTLSACETALGKVANGDDVVGFTRGFLYAGARSIVSSLWKVEDQATSILMQEFYKQLQEKDKREALRTAQLKVKNTYNSHPYFWAAFQITGAVE